VIKSILTLLTFTSAFAFACPKLEGQYTCQYSDGSSDAVIISQKNENGTTVYSLGATEVIADGKTHPVDQDDLKGTYIAQCAASSVNADVTGKVYDNGQPAADVTMTIKVNKTTAGANIEQSGEFKFGADVVPFEDKAICTLN